MNIVKKIRHKSNKQEKVEDDDLDFLDLEEEEKLENLIELTDRLTNGEATTNEVYKDVVDEVASIKERTESIETNLTNVTELLNEMRGSLAQSEENVAKLLSIYEVVSQKFNPFLESRQGCAGGQGQEVDPETELESYGASMPGPGIPGPAAAAPGSPERDANHGSAVGSGRLLDGIRLDFRSTVLSLRWVEMMLESVEPRNLPALLDYYIRIGWVTEKVKTQLMEIARGEKPGPGNWNDGGPMAELARAADLPTSQAPLPEPDGAGWRLKVDNHLRSLYFIIKLRGDDLDIGVLDSLQQEVSRIKSDMEKMYGL